MTCRDMILSEEFQDFTIVSGEFRDTHIVVAFHLFVQHILIHIFFTKQFVDWPFSRASSHSGVQIYE